MRDRCPHGFTMWRRRNSCRCTATRFPTVSPNPDVIQHMAHPESRADLDQFMEALLSGREPKRRGVFRFHAQTDSTDGTKRTPSPRNHPVRGRVGAIVGTGTEHQRRNRAATEKRGVPAPIGAGIRRRGALRRGLTTSRTTNLPLRAINRYCTDTPVFVAGSRAGADARRPQGPLSSKRSGT